MHIVIVWCLSSGQSPRVSHELVVKLPERTNQEQVGMVEKQVLRHQ